MSDRELLEAAAKAAGMEFRWEQPRGAKQPLWMRARLPSDGDAFPVWSPLEDDGQALRLAVKLGIIVCVDHDLGICGIHLPKCRGKYDLIEELGDDPYAATRKAIVRAAAAIKGEQSER